MPCTGLGVSMTTWIDEWINKGSIQFTSIFPYIDSWDDIRAFILGYFLYTHNPSRPVPEPSLQKKDFHYRSLFRVSHYRCDRNTCTCSLDGKFLLNVRLFSQISKDLEHLHNVFYSGCHLWFYFFFLPEVLISKDHLMLKVEHPNSTCNSADKSWRRSTLSVSNQTFHSS